MFGMNGQNLGDIEADIAADAMDAAVASMGEGMAGAQGIGGYRGGPSSQSGVDASDESNDPTFNFTSGQPLGPQIAQQQSFVDGLKAFMGLSPMQNVMQWGMSMMPEQMRAPTMNMNIDQLAAGVQAMGPGFELSPGLISSSFNGQMNVPMSGSGAHLGIASEIANIGGQNVHMGPGMTMNEDFFPGYGTNPFSGVAMADPGDPYIRPRRGTEIAGMI
tara:strand:- start:14895 stop:15548 length:654 start_codon:yes stop_codon:yes gene_type:complete